MDDLTQGFQLRVAAPSARSSKGLAWVLSRRNTFKTTPLIVGQVTLPRSVNHPQQLHDRLTQQLNLGGCFTFPYRPIEDDFIRLNTRRSRPLWLGFIATKTANGMPITVLTLTIGADSCSA